MSLAAYSRTVAFLCVRDEALASVFHPDKVLPSKNMFSFIFWHNSPDNGSLFGADVLLQLLCTTSKCMTVASRFSR